MSVLAGLEELIPPWRAAAGSAPFLGSLGHTALQTAANPPFPSFSLLPMPRIGNSCLMGNENRQKIWVTTLCCMFFIRRGKGKEKEERGGRHCVGPNCVCSFLLCLFSSKHPNKTTGADDSIMQSQETMGGRTTTK